MKQVIFFVTTILILTAFGFKDEVNKNMPNVDDTTDYLKKGDSISKITFDTLRTTLSKAIGEKGLSGALIFCNTRASSITAMYTSQGIMVSRVSDKERNPKNALSGYDKKQLDKYMSQYGKKEPLKPEVVYRNHGFNYYKPIIMQPMCLSCHGMVGKDIPKTLLPVIDSLYPKDKARGYKQGDLRGMWHIVFNDRKPNQK